MSSAISRISVVLFMLLGFFLPTQLGKHFFLPFSYISGVRVDYIAPTLFVTDLVVVMILWTYRVQWIKHLRTRRWWIVAASCAVNMVFSLIPWLSFYWAIRTFLLIALFLVMMRAHEPAMRALVIGLVAQTAIQLMLALVHLVSRHSIGGIWWALGERPLSTALPDIAKMTIMGVEYLRPYGTFSHPNSMGGLYALVAVWMLVIGLRKKLTIALFVMSIMLVALSFSKGALIGLGVGFIVWSTISLKTSARNYVAQVGGVGVSILLLAVALSQFVASDIIATPKRIALLAQAEELFFSNPLFGVGRGTYVVAQSGHDFGYSHIFAQPVHNIFALILVELGIVGVGVFIYLLWQSKMHKNRLLWPIAAVIVATGLIDHYWLTLIQNWYAMPIVAGLAVSAFAKKA